ncbi:transposase [Antarcticibacterium sp. 1MA-6-2]|uniref:REP-associated tyrosine transposase n=1 Tax=Antarcticibacterium sp. 1MA-6-2 TaxID=2908210 RepID=UPI001F2AAF91|nr:transposase [Antarcticibacterium sp. 1MA-6-2]UJH89888.1 transposase [Antarcticibacterium sp. 1MA-6-2]
MSTKYKATVPDVAYFITMTTVDWIDIFTRPEQKEVIIKSLRYCQQHKGLEIFAYCLMSNHLHMICKADEGILSDILRDFKKFTSKEIIKTIKESPESRRKWMLTLFERACEHLKRDQQYKVWQNGYHAESLTSGKFLNQKLNYIHHNPVKDRIVENPEDYLFSSARNYAGMEGELEVNLLELI